MCVAAIAWQAHPRWQLVIAANRDEYHARPTAPLARWADGSGTIAGRDLQSGGTWLGARDDGRVTLVTNYRQPGYPLPGLTSRGDLVAALLRGADPATIGLGGYNPFHLWHVDGQLHYLSSHPTETRIIQESGIHGLSNGPIDGPWPRRDRLAVAMRTWVDALGEPDALLAALADETPLSGEEGDRPAGPVFLRHSIYGTRCSTVVAFGYDGRGVIVERGFGAGGQVLGENRIMLGMP